MAGAASLEDLLTGALVPSAAPSLLGPITSAGRVGWECKPERSAAVCGLARGRITSSLRYAVIDASAAGRRHHLGLMAAAAAAQTYSPQRPLPRTTSMPALRALATRREIEERFTIGIDARGARRLGGRRCRVRTHRRPESARTKRFDRALRSRDRLRESWPI